MIRFCAGLSLGVIGLLSAACTDTAPQQGAAHEIVAPVADAPDYAAAEYDLSSPEGTAYTVMMAMYRGDAEMVDRIFAPDGELRRLRPDGQIDPNGLPKWRAWVETLEVGQANEDLFDIKVERYRDLAAVWAPFVIRFNGEIAGCGVNQFTMAEMDGEWRIVTGIDVQAPVEDCAGFREG